MGPLADAMTTRPRIPNTAPRTDPAIVSGASRTSGRCSSHRSNRSATQTDPNPKAGKSRVNIATLRKRFPMIVKSAFPGSITRGLARASNTSETHSGRNRPGNTVRSTNRRNPADSPAARPTKIRSASVPSVVIAPTTLPFSVSIPILEPSATIADARIATLVPRPPTRSPVISAATHDDASRSTAGTRSRVTALPPVTRTVGADASIIAASCSVACPEARGLPRGPRGVSTHPVGGEPQNRPTVRPCSSTSTSWNAGVRP